jgi:hypothetical protein
MKLYFAKYLPVEGVPQLGDMYLTNRPNYKAGPHLCAGNDGKIVWFQDGAPNITIYTELEFAKKVKLFLCSKDIRVGDKFTQVGVDMIHPTARFTCVEHDDYEQPICDEGRHWSKNTIYKVIGLISPEATWVKEGDEFDDNTAKRGFPIGSGEYRYFTFNEWHSFLQTMEKMGTRKQHEMSVYPYIRLKGECGHFH